MWTPLEAKVAFPAKRGRDATHARHRSGSFAGVRPGTQIERSTEMSVVENTHALLQSSGTWSVDPAHSTIEFRVRHMIVNTVKGWFRDFEGLIVTGEKPSVIGTIEVESIETMNGDRDAHLRSPDFFDSIRYPEIAFVADELTVNGDDTRFSLGGELTIKGTTRRIVLEGEHRGGVVDA